jgi:dephospho-CoA kinase
MDQVFARNPGAIAMVESALIFEVERDARQRGESEGVLADWRRRFDKVIVLTAPDELKVARYVCRLSPGQWDERIAADARLRLTRQLTDGEKAARADFVLENNGDLAELRSQVQAIWKSLQG